MYWPNVETTPGGFDWSAQDAAVLGDVAYGLQTNAILLGTPGFYLSAPVSVPPDTSARSGLRLYGTEAATPQGLYAPVFSDGSDIPGPGKQINPENRWARFVSTAVQRYRPGGVLAQAYGWPSGVGITHWEMWNEPDLSIFWDGSLADYARLLKVGYLATKQTDSQAQVLFGALANNAAWLGFYNEVMALYDADSQAAAHAYYHDILATHNYFDSWKSWYNVYRAKNTLTSRGLSKPIWLNESGVAAWNDYPGPTWDPGSGLRATVSEQADFVIQSAFYATYAGADAIFHFQLYDGCGNQPQGTDFPPHNGELCDANGMLISDPSLPCAGDANGLFRNPTDAACFTQHPAPESPRPSMAAFRLLTTYFVDALPYWRLRPGGSDPYNGPQEWIAFYQPSTGRRIVGLWARFGTAQQIVVPATASSALLLRPDGSVTTVTPQNGGYALTLPAATNLNAFWDPTYHAIGGSPLILIEADPGHVGPPSLTYRPVHP
jgi:hypothetical protein